MIKYNNYHILLSFYNYNKVFMGSFLGSIMGSFTCKIPPFMV